MELPLRLLMIISLTYSVSGAITAVKQLTYNTFDITSTGGAVDLRDEDNMLIPTTTAGNVLTLTDYATYGNSIHAATQASADGRGRDSFSRFDTWHDLYLRVANDGEYRTDQYIYIYI